MRAPRTAAIEIGENVLVSADGTRLVSAIDGFPRVGDGRIDVAPAARIDRDLDDRTGDIQAHGSLELHGGVTEGRQLRVRRDLSVTGSIERADVEVGGSATIDGIVMASTLRVGGLRGPATYLFQLVQGIPGELARATALIDQLIAAAAGKGQRLSRAQAASIVMSRYFADTARSLKQAAAYAAEQVEMLGAEPATALREAVTLLMAVESGQRAGERPRRGRTDRRAAHPRAARGARRACPARRGRAAVVRDRDRRRPRDHRPRRDRAARSVCSATSRWRARGRRCAAARSSSAAPRASASSARRARS